MSTRLSVICLTLSALALSSCVSDEPGRRKLPDQPASIQPTTLGVWATPPEDTDANGYLDTVGITVYVSSDRFPAPLQLPGTFTFRLVGKDKSDLAKWTIDEPTAANAVRRNAVGPGYFFRLNVKDVATDEVDAQGAELAATFTPTNGNPVHAPLTALRFGRIRPNPSAVKK